MMRISASVAGRLTMVVTVAALAALGCQKSTSGPNVADYQKQRAAIIEKQRQDLEDGKAAQVAKAEAGSKRGRDGGGGDGGQTFAGAGDGGFVYDPIGKRDPFRSFVLDRLQSRDESAKGPLEQFDLTQLSVTGVVWRAQRRRALVLDPSGRGYIVQEGDPIGKNDGRVISIGDSSVTVREAYVDFHGERTTKEIEMKVRASQGG